MIDDNHGAMPFLEARGLSRTYRDAEIPVQVFGNLNLDVERGEMLAIVGPSGIGKTLLSLKFLDAGVANGERCVYFGFYESPERLVAKAESVSIHLADAVADGRLIVEWRPAVELAIDELAAELISVVKRAGASRLCSSNLRRSV